MRLTIDISDEAAVSCLEFSSGSTTLEDAVQHSIETIMKVVRGEGQVNKYSPEELSAILVNFTKQHAVDNWCNIALQVEKTIEESATAKIAKPVEIAETAENLISAPRLNLYHQKRKPFSIIKTAKPNDRLIVQYLQHITKKYKSGDEISKEDSAYGAALELVYSNTTLDLWGSEIVEKQINQLVQLHLRASK